MAPVRRNTTSKHPKGIRPWKGGWQAYVRVGGVLHQKSYPLDTDLETMKTWRLQMKLTAPTTRTGATFAHDVTTYLTRVTAMPTYGQRAQHLSLWTTAFGPDRVRATITTADIDRVMQAWLTDGLKADTVRKRRVSLLALYHKLDGKKAANPVRESHPPHAARPIVRGLDTATLQRVLDSLPPSKTAARLRVMAWTGLPPGMLQQLTPADVNLKAKTVRVPARKKGAGAAARVVPLIPQAVAAFKELGKHDAYGKFAIAAAGRVLHRACKRSHVAPIRLYDLRHSFGALLYRVTKDLPTVARFLLHANLVSTARYAMAAVGDVDRAAAQLVGESLPHSRPQKLSRNRALRSQQVRKRA